MLSRRRGALLLDVLIAMGLLSLLVVLAAGLMWSATQVARGQLHSAQALAQAREALASLATDVSAARKVRCSGETLTLVTSNGQDVTYAETAGGLTRVGSRSRPAEWPLLQAEFALSTSGLVDVRLTMAGSGRRPAAICESAFWARALSTS